MSFLLALIPAPYRVLAEVLLFCALIGGVWGWIAYGKHEAREGGLKDGRAEVQQRWDADVSRQQKDAIAQAAANAQETQRRLKEQADAQHDHAQELARYKRAADDAVAARDGLQLDVDNLTAVARGGTRDTATAGERQAGAAAVGVLAELHRRTDAAAELYALTADAARRAGLLCSASYDALTPKGTP